jgi:predicted RNA-binding protein with PUA-like domain
VTLEAIKNNPLLAEMPLVRRSRLSIQPVSAEQWQVITAMGGIKSAEAAGQQSDAAFPNRG